MCMHLHTCKHTVRVIGKPMAAGVVEEDESKLTEMVMAGARDGQACSQESREDLSRTSLR